MLAMALHEGSGLLAHPKDSEDDNAVSIWLLPALRLIIHLPGMRQVHVVQGLFGAPSPKPTTLLALRLPTLEKDLHSGMLTTMLPHNVSAGRDEYGRFRTAPLKEYPPGLCSSIAKAFCTDFCKANPDVSMDWGVLPSAFLSQ